MTEKEAHPRVLIEDWFPYEEVGIECQRERGMVSALPPIYFLHVWWARRPLTISKASIIASLLPNSFDQQVFNKVILGLVDDLKKNYQKIRIERTKEKGEKIGYSGERIFKNNLNSNAKKIFDDALESLWKKKDISILDPMAGGGSIPFEASRLELNVLSSDINPVSTLIQKCTYEYPLKFGLGLIPKIKQYSLIIEKFLIKTLSSFIPQPERQINDGFLWVRTIKCVNPECELEVPLSPNWDIAKEPSIILEVIPPKEKKQRTCNFKVIEKPTKEQSVSNKPTVKGGTGLCPRCGSALDGDYIKKEAQAGRMGHQLMAIIYKESIGAKKEVRKFRVPNQNDLNAINQVNALIDLKMTDWRNAGILPDDDFPKGCDNRPIQYGMEKWYKFFNNRQLLTNMSILEQIVKIKKELLQDPKNDKEEVKAIITYLQFALDKIVEYNCVETRWHSARSVIAGKFDRHDYAFKWSYAEMDIIRKGFVWAVGNVLKAYKGLVELLGNSKSNIQVFSSPCQKLSYLKDETVDIVVVDPPYYDNVMYSEMSDFFYVWLKRGLGDLYPDLFHLNLTDKDNEAVANQSRFEGLGTSKKELAKQDYEAKMRDSFKEIHRMLKKHGILTIMFTHKATEAWDTLAKSLMDAGFEITASWPVSTESEHSLHIAKKNAVQTTILLVCRKRLSTVQNLWWEDDVLPKIKETIKQKRQC